MRPTRAASNKRDVLDSIVKSCLEVVSIFTKVTSLLCKLAALTDLNRQFDFHQIGEIRVVTNVRVATNVQVVTNTRVVTNNRIVKF